MTKKVMLAGLALVFCGSGLLAQQEGRPSQHPWARWQVGAWVKMSVSDGSGQELKSKQTLKRVGAKRYTVEEELQLGREPAVSKDATFVLGMGGYAHTTPGATRVGQDEIKVGGKTYGCVIWKSTWESGGTRVEESTWIADGCDLPLKIVSKQGSEWIRLIAASLADEVQVGGRTVQCVKYEGKRKLGPGIADVVAWRSLQVPGGVVKLISRSKTRTNVNQVVSFKGRLRDDVH